MKKQNSIFKKPITIDDFIEYVKINQFEMVNIDYLNAQGIYQINNLYLLEHIIMNDDKKIEWVKPLDYHVDYLDKFPLYEMDINNKVNIFFKNIQLSTFIKSIYLPYNGFFKLGLLTFIVEQETIDDRYIYLPLNNNLFSNESDRYPFFNQLKYIEQTTFYPYYAFSIPVQLDIKYNQQYIFNQDGLYRGYQVKNGKDELDKDNINQFIKDTGRYWNYFDVKDTTEDTYSINLLYLNDSINPITNQYFIPLFLVNQTNYINDNIFEKITTLHDQINDKQLNNVNKIDNIKKDPLDQDIGKQQRFIMCIKNKIDQLTQNIDNNILKQDLKQVNQIPKGDSTCQLIKPIINTLNQDASIVLQMIDQIKQFNQVDLQKIIPQEDIYLFIYQLTNKDNSVILSYLMSEEYHDKVKELTDKYSDIDCVSGDVIDILYQFNDIPDEQIEKCVQKQYDVDTKQLLNLLNQLKEPVKQKQNVLQQQINNVESPVDNLIDKKEQRTVVTPIQKEQEKIDSLSDRYDENIENILNNSVFIDMFTHVKKMNYHYVDVDFTGILYKNLNKPCLKHKYCGDNIHIVDIDNIGIKQYQCKTMDIYMCVNDHYLQTVSTLDNNGNRLLLIRGQDGNFPVKTIDMKVNIGSSSTNYNIMNLTGCGNRLFDTNSLKDELKDSLTQSTFEPNEDNYCSEIKQTMNTIKSLQNELQLTDNDINDIQESLLKYFNNPQQYIQNYQDKNGVLPFLNDTDQIQLQGQIIDNSTNALPHIPIIINGNTTDSVQISLPLMGIVFTPLLLEQTFNSNKPIDQKIWILIGVVQLIHKVKKQISDQLLSSPLCFSDDNTFDNGDFQ